jgi:histidyl-tRNA synthetase
MSKGALPGFRDFYPEQFAERAHILQVWRDVARRFAFVEYDGPPLEPLELFTRKSGEEIVAQLYNFRDKGDRDVALRPEMTPTFARMVAARANALRKPIRWFSVPQLFRYERQQKGRLREHFQLNVDIVGEADVSADAELLAVALEIMRGLGLGKDDVVARVSDRRILTGYLTSLGVAEDKLPAVFGVIDKLDRVPQAVSLDALASLGIDAKARHTLVELPHATIQMVGEALKTWRNRHHVEDFRRYLEFLEALGVTELVRFDLSIVRGLAYYTGIVFELFDTKGELRAICGGGRYDNLLHALGGVDLPALGFGMGDVVLSELLRARGLLPREVPAPRWWVAARSENDLRSVMRVAAALRSAGESVEYALRSQSLARQLKVAGALGVAGVVILHEDFELSRRLTLKSMLPGGSEEGLDLDALLRIVGSRRGAAPFPAVEQTAT